jgi:predicted secreted hydrolase
MRSSLIGRRLLASAAAVLLSGPVRISSAPPLAAAPPAWLTADPGYRWSFPRDHGTHPGYQNEWWYFTGHLESVDPPGGRFGYQLTLFRIGLLPAPPPLQSRWASANLLMGHAAITDLARGEHHFSELLFREMPDLAGFGAVGGAGGSTIAWSRAPAGTDGVWQVRWEGDRFELEMADQERGMAFSLKARPVRPVVFQGPNGFVRKAQAPGHASLYTSVTRLETQGTLTVGDQRWTVKGLSWMDQEFGSNQLAPEVAGWDWYSLQLADGRDLMLYVMRRKDGGVELRNGTLVGQDGRVRYLAAGDWSVRAEGSWTSRASKTSYPAGWAVEVPGEGLHLQLRPNLADQENRAALAGIHYWEGSVQVLDGGGRPFGQGYVELTGHGQGNRPPL